MTKQMDEFFNLPSLSEETEEIISSLPEPVADKSIILGVREDEHDSEMNTIFKKAIDIHDEIAEVARNVEPSRSARMFEVSGQYLKTALDASNSKVDRQLKAAKLKIEAARLKIDDANVKSLNNGREIVADRNEMIRMLLRDPEEKILDIDTNEK